MSDSAKPTTAKSDTVKQIVNAPEIVTAFGRTYEIKSFTFGPMTEALDYIAPMGYLLRRLAGLPKGVDPKTVSDEVLNAVMSALSISGPSIMGLVSIATREPKEWLELQDPMDGLRLFAKVVEKNLGFFSQQNLDQITKFINGLQGQIPTSGGASSTS